MAGFTRWRAMKVEYASASKELIKKKKIKGPYRYFYSNKPESEFSPIPRAKSTYSDINTLKTFQMYQVFSVSTISTRQGLILTLESK